jgi:type IV pilus assembly protein PilY1
MYSQNIYNNLACLTRRKLQLVLLTTLIGLFLTGTSFAGVGGNGTLTIEKNGTGSGTVTSSPAGIDCGADCSEPFAGETVTLTASPADGSLFSGWSGQVPPSQAKNSVITITIPPNQDVLLTATFTENITYTVAASVSGLGGIVVPDSQLVAANQSASIDIIPNAGWAIVSITDNGNAVAIANPYVIDPVTDDHNVVVTFAGTFDVNASVDGGHGSVSPPTQSIADGLPATIVITPDPGYHIASITDNGTAMSITNPYVIASVITSHSVVVSFEPDAFSYGDMSEFSVVPPYVMSAADANVLIALSVEWPVSGPAYPDQNTSDPPINGDCTGRIDLGGADIGICYSNDKDFLGYFDPKKCYIHDGDKFVPVGPTINGHECSGQWSGNLLNWATMTAIDVFRWSLTGGRRVIDDTTETVLERAEVSSSTMGRVWPVKGLDEEWNVDPATVTPFSHNRVYIQNNTDNTFDIGSAPANDNLGQNIGVRVKVCDPGQGLEDNCVAYGSYFKPEGLLQRNDDRMRFALMSYLLDNDGDRHGGVLRANMKYVGPYKPLVGSGITINDRKEWDTDGILILNPESAAEGDSGIINYLNKFGANGYKSKDPVAELFYEGIRYFKNIGPTPEYSSGATAADKDGFPAITAWEDPITGFCQQCFMIYIGDQYTWYDTRLPGNYITGATFTDDAGHSETVPYEGYGEPSNADTDINVRDLTNTVGDLEGLHGTQQRLRCTKKVCDMDTNNLKELTQLGEVYGTDTSWNSYYISGLAYYANTTDLRPEAAMPGDQTVKTFAIDVMEYAEGRMRVDNTNMFYLAGKYGGFDEQDFQDTNADGNPYEPNLQEEWDEDGDGFPDNFVFASDPAKLVNGLEAAFGDILARVSSGTAASVISNSHDGEGAIYQSTFFPTLTGSDNRTVDWVGEIHSMFVDAYGNMREDTNANRRLDLLDDRIIVYDGADVFKFDDLNGNGMLDAGTEFTDTNGNGSLDDAELGTACCTFDDINYLWNSSTWLNHNSLAATTQRTYSAADRKRYIFTFIDGDGDMVADGGEQVAFTTANKAAIGPYLHLFTPFGYGPSNPPPGISAGDFTAFTDRQVERIIDFIRGEDQGQDTVGSSIIPRMRSRLIDNDGDGTPETFRLGDVAHSTPTVVAAPGENYDVIYGDSSYARFYRRYKNRRSVIYVGANDGMLHAFNGGFFEDTTNKFWKNHDGTTFDDNGPDLGAELWAYIPFNLLPHLHWLTDPNYQHIYYVDLKPRIFDARIFADDGENGTHPGGWGTILVGGMRYGGTAIRTDKNHDGVFDSASDLVMKSSYFILDISDPENPPVLLAEVTFDDLGYTTCYPTAFFIDPKNAATGNDWYLVLGSGPIGPTGADTNTLDDMKSTQNAKIYIIDLKKLAYEPSNRRLRDPDDSTLPAAGPYYTVTDNASYISAPIAVDYDLDYRTDAVYFGTITGVSPNWGGKMRRIEIMDDPDPTNWNGNSVLLDTGQPVTASASVAKDSNGRIWIFFGTGRFENREDISNTQMQTFYGIKEPCADPCETSSDLTFAEVYKADLFDVTNAVVYEGGYTVEGVAAGVDTFEELTEEIENNNDGWFIDFDSPSGERNLGQPTVFGAIVTFTTYIPAADPCQYQGDSNLYAVYYETGSAFVEPVIGVDMTQTDPNDSNNGTVLRKASLGSGLAMTPALHTGKQNGSNVFIQTSTGAVEILTQENPGVFKSGQISWRDE